MTPYILLIILLSPTGEVSVNIHGHPDRVSCMTERQALKRTEIKRRELELKTPALQFAECLGRDWKSV